MHEAQGSCLALISTSHCSFSNKIRKSPRPGIEPGSPAWQAGILTTILPRMLPLRHPKAFLKKYRTKTNKLLFTLTPKTGFKIDSHFYFPYELGLHVQTKNTSARPLYYLTCAHPDKQNKHNEQNKHKSGRSTGPLHYIRTQMLQLAGASWSLYYVPQNAHTYATRALFSTKKSVDNC